MTRKVGRTLTATLSFNPSGGGTGPGYVRSLTVNGAMIPSTQTDFPVLLVLLTLCSNRYPMVDMSYGNLTALILASIQNVNKTTKLKWEVERYNPVTGEIVAHVKNASVAGGTVFDVGYGDSSITTDQSDTVENVWTNSFRSIYHLKDGTTLSVSRR